jgi:hypothetical protein
MPSQMMVSRPCFCCAAAGSFLVPCGPRPELERDDEPREVPLVERARDVVDRVLVAMRSR